MYARFNTYISFVAANLLHFGVLIFMKLTHSEENEVPVNCDQKWLRNYIYIDWFKFILGSHGRIRCNEFSVSLNLIVFHAVGAAPNELPRTTIDWRYNVDHLSCVFAILLFIGNRTDSLLWNGSWRGELMKQCKTI